jgi:MYXO-CTERM domain-containing protein
VCTASNGSFFLGGTCGSGNTCQAHTPTVTSTATATATASATPTRTPVPQGGECTDVSQCVTDLLCADGVCCNTACDQPLEQCNLPGRGGMCASTAAAAPAASSTGLLAMLGVLILAAFVAIRVRRHA